MVRKRRVQAELAKVNKKDFGKKVRCDELIGTALSLLTEQHFKELQDGSLTNAIDLRFFLNAIGVNRQISVVIIKSFPPVSKKNLGT